jgi:predicted lipoprotein with Yx(FWY)xxD motif
MGGRRVLPHDSERSTGRLCVFHRRQEITMKIPKMMAVAGAVLSLGVAVAGCGSSSSSSATPPSAGTNAAGGGSGGRYGYGSGSGSPSVSTGGVTLDTASSSLGTILVDQEGKTLYLFEADSTNKSNCSGSCATYWPPVTTSGKAAAGSGVSAAMIGTAMRSDGTSQVTYAGHPLYWFSGDSKPGDTNGEGLTNFGGAWYAVSPAGKAVTSS